MKNNNSFVTLNQTILSYSDWDQVNESLVLDNCKFGNVTEVEKKYETRI